MNPKEALSKMRDHAETVLSYCNGCSYEQFLSSPMLTDACMHHIGHIGEIAIKLHNKDSQIEKEYPSIKWRDIRGIRNYLFHDYDGINHNIIWEVIEKDLPELIAEINMLL